MEETEIVLTRKRTYSDLLEGVNLCELLAAEWLNSFIPPNSKILNVSCGNGNLSRFLKLAGHKCYNTETYKNKKTALSRGEKHLWTNINLCEGYYFWKRDIETGEIYYDEKLLQNRFDIIILKCGAFHFDDNDKIIMDNNDWIELIDFFDQILNKEGKIILGLGPPYYIEIPEVLKNWAYLDDTVTNMGETFLKTGLLE